MLNHGREVSERTEQIIAKFWHKLRISLWKMMKGKQWRSLYRISLKWGNAKKKKKRFKLQSRTLQCSTVIYPPAKYSIYIFYILCCILSRRCFEISSYLEFLKYLLSELSDRNQIFRNHVAFYIYCVYQ